MEIKEVGTKDNIAIEKITNCLSNILELIQNNRFKVGELILLYGNLGYSIGASIEGEAKTIEELNKLYYTNPTVGIALMLNGAMVNSWFDDYNKITKSEESL